MNNPLYMEVEIMFFRGMLSAAHVLAMDSKNLLDVIDSIRVRCPEVEVFLAKRGTRQPGPATSASASVESTRNVPSLGPIL